MPDTKLISLAVPTREGTFIATYSDAGLAALDFPGRRKAPPKPARIPASVRAWHKLVTKAIQATLAGKAPGELPPLDVRNGTEFQQRVWEELLRIPTGHARSYGELARILRQPGAARAVGSACGANPIPLLIPCHRVLAADGRLGGFSGGLDWKRRLLAVEGVSAS
jgi:methylated-DNA-[protein]-cysteine S-methyltransferase